MLYCNLFTGQYKTKSSFLSQGHSFAPLAVTALTVELLGVYSVSGSVCGLSALPLPRAGDLRFSMICIELTIVYLGRWSTKCVKLQYLYYSWAPGQLGSLGSCYGTPETLYICIDSVRLSG